MERRWSQRGMMPLVLLDWTVKLKFLHSKPAKASCHCLTSWRCPFPLLPDSIMQVGERSRADWSESDVQSVTSLGPSHQRTLWLYWLNLTQYQNECAVWSWHAANIRLAVNHSLYYCRRYFSVCSGNGRARFSPRWISREETLTTEPSPVIHAATSSWTGRMESRC